MFYDVRVLDPRGKLKRIVGGAEHSLQLWGIEKICKKCGATFKIINDHKNKKKKPLKKGQGFAPNLIPERKNCDPCNGRRT